MNPNPNTNQKSKRKVTMGVMALALVVILLVSFTIAYLTDSRTVLNLLGIGAGVDENGNPKQAVMLSLTEPSFVKKAGSSNVEYLTGNGPDAEKGTPGEVTKATVSNLMPGDKIYKDPTIKNTGSEAVYLRVKFDVDSSTLSTLTGTFGLALNDENAATASGFFKLHTDGYYYFTKDGNDLAKFEPDSVADFFVTQTDESNDKYSMAIPATWGNAELTAFLGTEGAKLLELPITAEAIQAKNYDPGDGLGWENPGTIVAVSAANRKPATTP